MTGARFCTTLSGIWSGVEDGRGRCTWTVMTRTLNRAGSSCTARLSICEPMAWNSTQMSWHAWRDTADRLQGLVQVEYSAWTSELGIQNGITSSPL